MGYWTWIDKFLRQTENRETFSSWKIIRALGKLLAPSSSLVRTLPLQHEDDRANKELSFQRQADFTWAEGRKPMAFPAKSRRISWKKKGYPWRFASQNFQSGFAVINGLGRTFKERSYKRESYRSPQQSSLYTPGWWEDYPWAEETPEKTVKSKSQGSLVSWRQLWLCCLAHSLIRRGQRTSVLKVFEHNLCPTHWLTY